MLAGTRSQSAITAIVVTAHSYGPRVARAEYLVLDIETIPDVERWHRPELPPGTEPPFPPTWAHRIVVIGCLWLDHGCCGSAICSR